MEASVHRRTFLATGAAGLLTAQVARAGGGVDESGYVSIGGIDQWVGLRGPGGDAPALLFLHGGPADAQSAFRELFAPWERWFTVVQWDQRGAGLTFARNGEATPDLTLDRLVRGGLEGARHASARLGGGKPILVRPSWGGVPAALEAEGESRAIVVGHSWGAILAAHMLRADASAFSAYVGTGQVVSWAKCVAGQYAFTVAAAEAAGNSALGGQLRASGAPAPADFAQIQGLRRAMSAYEPASDQAYYANQRRVLGDPARAADPAVQAYAAGGQFSLPRLIPTLMAADLEALGPWPDIPFHLIQGRDDHITPTDAAEAYLGTLRPPARSQTRIDGGHFAAFMNAEGFAKALAAAL